MRPPGYDAGRHAMADERRLREMLGELQAVGLGALVLLGFLCWRLGGPNPVWRPTYSARVRQRCSLPPGLSCPGC
jgi:hypothetical protein